MCLGSDVGRARGSCFSLALVQGTGLEGDWQSGPAFAPHCMLPRANSVRPEHRLRVRRAPGALESRWQKHVHESALGTLAELLLGRSVQHLAGVGHARARDDLVFEVERQLALGDEFLEERLDVLREHLARVHGDFRG